MTSLFMDLEGKCSDVCLANPVTVCLCISHRVLAACQSQRQIHKYKDDYKIQQHCVCKVYLIQVPCSDMILGILLVIIFGHLALWSVGPCAQFHKHNLTNTCMGNARIGGMQVNFINFHISKEGQIVMILFDTLPLYFYKHMHTSQNDET